MEELLAANHEFYTDDHRFWKEETGNGAASAARNKWNKIARQTSMAKKRHGDEPEKGERTSDDTDRCCEKPPEL